MLRYRTQGLLAAGLGLLLTGCFSDPDLKTGLRPEGAPEVLAVLTDDPNNGVSFPTFCKYVGGALDPKGPSLVQGFQVCPDAETDFEAAELDPLLWNIRVMFDELLKGEAVETLLDSEPDAQGNPQPCTSNSTTCTGHIDTTLPFDLSCGGNAIAYDGYYYPNGNKESNPVGPALVLTPLDLAPTDTDCTLTIKPEVVKDKDGVSVPTGANLNVFTLHVSRLDVVETDPADADAVDDREVVAADGVVTFVFNSLVDDASVSVTDVTLTNIDTNLPVPASVSVADNVIEVGGVAALPAGNYSAKITAGAVIDDVVGGTRTFADEIQVRFVVE